MMKFKDLSYTQYDFGGLAQHRASPELQAIARFKLGFGGRPLTEYTGFVPGNRLGRLLIRLKETRT
jgi:hypothetical protein